MPTSTDARRDKIAAATVAMRRAAIARRESAAAATEKIYEHLADQLADWLRQHQDSQGRVPPDAQPAFDLYLQALLREAQDQFLKLFGESRYTVANMAGEIFGAGPGLIDRTLQGLSDFVGADGLQLSDRIWRVNEHTRTTLQDLLAGAIMRGETAMQTARDFIARGEAVPATTSLLIRGAQPGPIATTLRFGLTQASGNPLRNLLRVLRTEVNRAFTESFVASAMTHPDVAAVKFNLSPNHPRTDVCDLYASANLHGLGPGVYPAGNHPYPAHPDTLSFLTVVFVDEITDDDRAGQQTASDWLRTRPGAEQDAILGLHKGDAFRAGQLPDANLFARWRDLRPGLEPGP